MERIIKQLAITLLFLSGMALAQSKGELFYIYKKLPPKKHGVIVKFTDHAQIKVGTILQATSSNGVKCNLKVIKIKSSLALTASDLCPFEKELLVNQKLKRVDKKEFINTNKQLGPYIYKKLEGDNIISIQLPKGSNVKVGTALIATQFERQSCVIKVLRVYDTYAIGETTACPFRSQLKENQPLLPLISNNSKDKDLGNFLIKPEDTGPIRPGFSKKWYTYWGIGYGFNSIEGPDATITMAGENHSEFTFDLLGFYFPFKKTNLLMGGILNTILDSFDYTSSGGTVYNISYIHLMPAFSAIYFLGPQAGTKWFLRGDIGLAKYFRSVNSTKASSSIGIGLLLGGGYGWKINFQEKEFNILANAYYSHREVSTQNDAFSVDSFTLSVGILY